MDVEKLLGEMTIQEKVGQMFLLAFSGDRLDEARVLMEENMVGAAYISNENVPTPEAAYDLTTKLGQFAGNTRLQLPLMLGVDQEGAWSVMYPGSSPGPGNMAIGATLDPDMAYKMYEVIGKELHSVGLNTLLAPCADCNSNPANSIIGMRSFGEKPGLVGQMTAAAVHGARTGGVIVTPKHFPGHGDTSQDSHRDLPTVARSVEELQAIDLHPFAESVQAGAGMVMTAHIIFSALDPDNPATLSPAILNDVLHDQMGFDGVVLSDSMNMMAMKRHYDPKEAAIQAFLAGVDLLMLAEEHYDHNAEQYLANQQALIGAAIEANAAGTLPTARIDEAVRRVLTLKADAGLTLEPPVAKNEAIEIVGSDAHRHIELDVATAAVSILRNRSSLLPLNATQKILLVNTTSRKSYEPLGATRGIGPNQTDASFDLFEAALKQANAIYRSRSAEDVLAANADPTEDEVIVAVTENFPLPGMDFDQESQAQVVNRLHDQYPDQLVIVALRDPYELRLFPDVNTYLCTFSFRKPAAEAAASRLFDVSDTKTTSPVSVAAAGIEAADRVL